MFSDTHSNTAYWSSGGAGSTAWGRYRPWYSAESRTEFAEDSSLEGDGFEPSVPRRNKRLAPHILVFREPIVRRMGFSGPGN